MRGRILKCAIHPKNEALGICNFCGRFICDICQVNVLNVPHCKGCAEQVIYHMATGGGNIYRAKKPPYPRGRPSSKLFVYGYLGSSLMALGALFLWVLGMHRRLDFLSQEIWEIFWLIGVPVLCLGMAISAVGFYGFYINYGSTMGYISAIIIPISALFFLSIFIYSFFIYYEVGRFSTGLGSLSIGFILMAITILKVDNYVHSSYLSKITSVLFFAAAGLTWVIFITEAIGIGWLVLLFACILLALLFSKIKLPTGNLLTASSPSPLVRTAPFKKPINLK